MLIHGSCQQSVEPLLNAKKVQMSNSYCRSPHFGISTWNSNPKSYILKLKSQFNSPDISAIHDCIYIWGISGQNPSCCKTWILISSLCPHLLQALFVKWSSLSTCTSVDIRLEGMLEECIAFQMKSIPQESMCGKEIELFQREILDSGQCG